MNCSGKPSTSACNTVPNTPTSYTCVECTASNSIACTGFTPACNTTTNTCVQCTNNSHCSPPLFTATPYCSSTTNTCKSCIHEKENEEDELDIGCTNIALPLCDETFGTCVKCLDSNDCSENETDKVCRPSTKTCVECLTSSDCTFDSSKPACNTTSFTCEQCSSDGDCASNPNGSRCDLTAGSPKINTCVECLFPSDCPTGKTCNLSTNTCVCPSANPVCGATCCPAVQVCDGSSCVDCYVSGTNTINCSTTYPVCKSNTCVQCDENDKTACKNPTPACNIPTNECVPCTDTDGCLPATPACKINAGNPALNSCKQCVNNSDCTNMSYPFYDLAKPICDPATNQCVGCTDTDTSYCSCPPGPVTFFYSQCKGLNHTCCPCLTPVWTSGDDQCCPLSQVCGTTCCPSNKVCDTTTTTCVECTTDSHCTGGRQCNLSNKNCCPSATPGYNTSSSTCVQCTNDTHCSSNPVNKTCKLPPTPVIGSGPQQYTCVQCQFSALECPSGQTCNSNTNTCVPLIVP